MLQGGEDHGKHELNPHQILMIPVTQIQQSCLLQEDHLNQNRLFQEGCLFKDMNDLKEWRNYNQ